MANAERPVPMDITAIGELVPSAILAATPAVDHDGISALRARKVGS